MKKTIIGLSFIVVVLISIITTSCTKGTGWASKLQPVDTIFSVNSKMKHTKDTINLGDTIYITASGIIKDTTNTISAGFSITSSGNLVGADYYSSLKKTISYPINSDSLYSWTSKPYLLCPMVSHKSSLTITATFNNSLSLSTGFGNLSATDSKTIYVR